MNHRFFRKATGIRLIVDKPNRKSHGFCFICFENVQACNEAFKNRDELSFAGRKLMVDYIGPRSKDPNSSWKPNKFVEEKEMRLRERSFSRSRSPSPRRNDRRSFSPKRER